MTVETKTKEVRVTHRCKPCKRFISELVLIESRYYVSYNRRRVHERLVNADGTSRHDIRKTCPCGRQMGYVIVNGRKNDQPCDARCMGAKGPSCECSCGGHNHGSSYAA